MKKLRCALLLLAIMGITFSGVGWASGVAPREFTPSEVELLEALGLHGEAFIASFEAPAEARCLDVNCYVLSPEGKWEQTEGGSILMDENSAPEERLKGTFSILIKEERALELTIKTIGIASYKTAPIASESYIMVSCKILMSEPAEIELDREIPVAIMLYDDGTSMRTYAPSDFFSPEKFEGMDIAQAVTLTFRGGADTRK